MNYEHYVLNLKTKTKEPLIGQNENEEYTVQFGRNTGEFLVLTNKPSDFRRIYLLKGGKLSPFTPELKADVDEFQVSDDRRRLAYAVNNKGFFEVKVIDLATKREIAVPKIAK